MDMGRLERRNGHTRFNKNLCSGTRVGKRGPTQVRTDIRTDVTVCIYNVDTVFFSMTLFIV
jgi:hypothetical protein